MYVMVTSRCNMTCKHCMFACTSEGEDMTLKVFKKTLDRCAEHGGILVLGGGEPTIHPKFWDFLGRALGYPGIEHIFMVTNGSVTHTALALAALASKGVIGCALSQDPWHAPIDPCVVRAFQPNPGRRWRQDDDRREIRNVRDLVPYGRCDELMASHAVEDGCGCEGSAFIRPDGLVYQCGCPDAPCVGDVFGGFKSAGRSRHDDWPCWQKLQRDPEAVEENGELVV